MSFLKRANQGGFMGVYLVVGAVLVLATILMISWAQGRGEQARKEQAIAAADEKIASQEASDGEVMVDDEDQSATVKEDDSQPEAVGVVYTDDLPKTGPNEAVDLLILLALSLSLAYYLSSRRLVRFTSLT